jgi:2-polyprenyl-3-methyl-5-hydroxy-6-metoxy-1,4-benzoquinol methylase
MPYLDGAREEVRHGKLSCGCGRHYPISEFVLSFAGLFPPELEREASFWDRFYMWHLEQGAKGFHDLQRGFAPFMAHGVKETFPYADTIDRYDVHQQVAGHPLLRRGRTLLDMGVGLGWTSLHFAGSGYAVTAFDPSLRPVQAAKSYAVEQGVFIEYICAAVGYINFRPGSFDNVTAFHSLHHVPDLDAGLSDVRNWLRPGGCLAVDEHITNSKLAGAIGGELHKWAGREIFPQYQTISKEDLATLPSEPHSAFEDAGAGQIVPLVHRMFSVKYEKARHVVLDHYPLLYYLWKGKKQEAFLNALEIANHLQEILRLVDPDGGEYVTLIATNDTAIEESANVDVTITKDRVAMEESADISTRSAELDSLMTRQLDLEAAFAQQRAWARELEAAVHQRDEEIATLRDHLKRMQSGRVMRLLRIAEKLKTRRPTTK